MTATKIEFQKLGFFFERWARTGKAIDMASFLAMLATAGAFWAMGSGNMAAVALFVSLAVIPYHRRRVERLRRGREILNRYSLHRNPKPLGL